MTALVLALYALVLGCGVVLVWRRPLLALPFWIVGLALHNAVMASLFGLGVRGFPLTLVQAWKEVLLAVGLARVGRDAWRARALPFRPRTPDLLAAAFAVLVLVYALVPQSVLDGEAGAKAVLYGARHDLAAVGAYFLGRSLVATAAELRRLAVVVVASAAGVALLGILDDYLVSIAWWRGSAVPRYFHDQLDYRFNGTGNAGAPTLPENFTFNLGTETHFLRRLVSIYLSPLAAAYALVVALVLVAAGAVRGRAAVLFAVLATAALVLTYTRSAILVLPVALLGLALLRRRPWLAALAGAAAILAVGWTHVYPHVAPQGHWTKVDIVRQRAQAAKAQTAPGKTGASSCGGEASLCSHWTSLKEGVRTVVHHPQGFGLGNAGVTATRNDLEVKAGESNYTELGVETGILGAFLWAAWGSALVVALARARVGDGADWLRAGLACALAAVLLLAIQTDVLGDPWLAYSLWALAGIALRPRATFQP